MAGTSPARTSAVAGDDESTDSPDRGAESLGRGRESLDRASGSDSTDAETVTEPTGVGQGVRSEEPLDVCLLSYRSDPHSGGQGVYVKHLSRALVDQGHSVDVVSGEPYPDLDPRVGLVKLGGTGAADAENVLSEFELGYLRDPVALFEWASALTGGFPEPYTFGKRVVRHFERTGNPYDVVHDNQSLSYGLLELLDRGIPTVATIHHPITVDRDVTLDRTDSLAARLRIRRWYRFLSMQKAVARELPNLVTVSNSAAERIAEDFGVSRGRLNVVYNGVDTDVFRPFENVDRNPNRIITTASADSPLKGLEYLLQAFSRLREEKPELELVMIGGIPDGGRISDLVYWLGIEDAVRVFNGISTERMVELYASSSLAVVPSLFEGFGFPVAEAMACRVPTVATSGGALPEVVGDAGRTVPPGEVDGLAQEMGTLLDSPGLRDSVGERGRERVESNFCWEEAARETVAVYRETIDAVGQ